MTNNLIRQKILGIVLIFAGLGSFFILMTYFNLFGQAITYSPDQILKILLALFLPLMISGFGAGYAFGGYGGGVKSGAGVLIILGAAFLAGFIKFNIMNHISQTEEERIKNIGQHLLAAKESWQSGDFALTISESDKALGLAKTDDERAGPHYWKGVGLYRLGQMSEAEIEEKEAMRLSPDFVGPYVTLGAVYAAQGRKKESEEMARKAIEIDPTYAWGYNLLGTSFLEAGKYKEGIELLKKAIELDPDQSMFRNNLKIAEQEAAKNGVSL